ncbi:hypothetical protein AMJ80_02710 [bacterium SM23_31]|nr:MAG: hypothetical protein AMJ80_02710 [bacterium SM23_31]
MPVYVITGAEDYLRETAVNLILNKSESAGKDTIAVKKLFGDEIDAGELNINLVSYSLFTDKEFILIKDARKMNSECWNILEGYVKNPRISTTVILEDEKLDERIPAVKFLKENAAWYNFPILYDNQLIAWLREYAAKLDFSMNNDALYVLKDSTEPALRNYVNEFEKIQLFAQAEKELSEDDIIEIIYASRSFNIFEFMHALCETDSIKTLEFLQQFILYNESAPRIFVMIVRHLTILLKIKLYSARSIKSNEIAKIVKVPYFRFNRYVQQAAQISIDDILILLEAVLEADTHLKTGYRSDKMIITLLIQKFKSIFNK